MFVNDFAKMDDLQTNFKTYGPEAANADIIDYNDEDNEAIATSDQFDETMDGIPGGSDSVDVEIKDLMLNRPSGMTTDNHQVMTSYELRGSLPAQNAPAGKTFIGESTNGQTFGKSTERFNPLYGSLSPF